jgi:hypothetical protein
LSLRRRNAAFALVMLQPGMTFTRACCPHGAVRFARAGSGGSVGAVLCRFGWWRDHQRRRRWQDAPPASGAIDAAGIEIILADGTRLYIRHAAQLPLLRPVITALRG